MITKIEIDNIKEMSTEFQKVIANLGFNLEDDCLYLTKLESQQTDPQIQFHIETTEELSASAVYLRRQLNGSYKPQVYLYDFTDRNFEETKENEISYLHATHIGGSTDAVLLGESEYAEPQDVLEKMQNLSGTVV